MEKKLITKFKESKSLKFFKHGLEFIYVSVLIPTSVQAAGFDIDGGARAATAPLVAGLDTYWYTFVLIGAGTFALMGEGDPKQRIVRGVMGGIVGGVAKLALFGMLRPSS